MSGVGSFLNRFYLIRQIPVFSECNWFDIQKIVHKAIINEYRKGDIISQEGNPPDYFYCLVSGRVQAYSGGFGKVKDNIDYIHRGMYFGIISTFTGENHSMTFEAMNDSVVLKIPKDDFKEILKKVPKLGLVFSKSLSKRMRRKVKQHETAFESNIISIYSPMKGTGSSTYAINFALTLREETNKKVILVILRRPGFDEDDDFDSGGPVIDHKSTVVALSRITDNYYKTQEAIIRDDLSIDLLNVQLNTEDVSLRERISPFVSSLVGE